MRLQVSCEEEEEEEEGKRGGEEGRKITKDPFHLVFGIKIFHIHRGPWRNLIAQVLI